MSFWCLLFSQKRNENNSTRGTIVVKSNFFVRFFGELKIPKRHFEINWPLEEEEILIVSIWALWIICFMYLHLIFKFLRHHIMFKIFLNSHFIFTFLFTRYFFNIQILRQNLSLELKWYPRSIWLQMRLAFADYNLHLTKIIIIHTW